MPFNSCLDLAHWRGIYGAVYSGLRGFFRYLGALDKSGSRSDEQMGYYVAQAREIIDQSMLSQREIIEELRRLGQTGDLFAEEAAG